MECQHAERQPSNQEQLDLSRVPKLVWRKSKRDSRHSSSAAMAGQAAAEVIHADRRQSKGRQDDRIVRCIWIAGQPVHRRAEEAASEVKFRKCESILVGIED